MYDAKQRFNATAQLKTLTLLKAQRASMSHSAAHEAPVRTSRHEMAGETTSDSDTCNEQGAVLTLAPQLPC